MNKLKTDTICALTSGSSTGPISIIRISGDSSIRICNNIFSKNINDAKSHTIHFGKITYKKEFVDEVLVSIFKGPKSYTGEDIIEISCHGSQYIQNRLLQILIKEGARIAKPGEFSMRAFQNGKLDLSQAEAVADLIASESKITHETALYQLKGGFSRELEELRTQLIDFASLIELELDFSEEDVEFADRNKFMELLNRIQSSLKDLIDSYKLGNVIKNGIPVVILGAPNVGKSTLLNLLLNEERAIVSEIAGTTRDMIEDTLIIKDVEFRFIDTAGLRDTNDVIENIGIKKTLERAQYAQIIIYLLDASENIKNQQQEIKRLRKKDNIISVVNKIDLNEEIKEKLGKEYIYISAKEKVGIKNLKKKIIQKANIKELSNKGTIVTNMRHYEELTLTFNEIQEIINNLKNNVSGDLLSTNIRQALFHLGSITGEVTTDDLLKNIFSRFCIGK